jgi:type II secretory pathway component PulK
MVHQRRQRGLVLLIVLWTIAILLILAATTRQTSGLDTKLSVFTTQEMRCKWAARAGVEKAVAILNEDDRTTDCATELWGNDPKDLADVPLQGCHYTVKIADEAGKLNINTATRDQFLGLLDWGMDESIADAIIDWRDADEEPGEQGTEGGYYENLPYRYKIRNGPFKTVRELLKVRGVTEEMFYGTASGAGQGGAGTRTAASLLSDANATSTSARRGWGEFMTCYTSSAIADTSGVTKVDINQASSQDMQDQLGITAAQAQAIIDNRPSNGYTSIGDLLGGSSTTSTTGTTATQSTVMTNNAANATTTTPAVLDTQTFRNIIDLITVGSQQGGTTTAGGSTTTGTTGGGSSTTDQNAGGQQTTAGGSSSGSSTSAATTDAASATTTTAASAAKTKININTAPVEVLVALWGGTDLAYDLAYNVVSYRDSTLLGIQSLGELLDVPSMTTDAFKQILDQVTLQSNLYSITSVATADQTGISGATWVVEAVIDRGQSPAKILYWYEGACP